MRQILAALGLALVLAGCETTSGTGPAVGGLAARAKSHIGASAPQLGLPPRLWCADFMNMMLGRQGASRSAASYRSYGSAAAHGCIDCIAVLAPCRRGGHWHVGVVSGYDANGNPIIVSGNHNHRVAEGVYPRQCVMSYRSP